MTSQFEINENTRARYFLGWKNQVIRLYYYLNEGLSLVNQFRYLIGAILAFAYLVKLTNYIHISIMFLSTLPVLILIGYVWVTRAKKSMEWFGLEHTTVFGKYGIQMQERNIEILEDIKIILEKNNAHR